VVGIPYCTKMKEGKNQTIRVLFHRKLVFYSLFSLYSQNNKNEKSLSIMLTALYL